MLRISIRSTFRRSSTSRTYAISRFPTRRPVGSGRSCTDRDLTKNPAQTSHSSEQESPLWEHSQNINTTPGYSTVSLARLLSQDILVIERQIEMLNIFVGFEQTNKYSINGIDGTPLGFIAEEPGGFLSTLSRQVFATHRPFRALIMDTEGNPILWARYLFRHLYNPKIILRRPFAWINSRMYAQCPSKTRETTKGGVPILDTFAEVQQIWHPWRRRYDLFLRETSKRILSVVNEPQPEPQPSVFSQFAKVDAPFLAWSFSLRDARDEEIAFIGREFRGFGREIFTDTGLYYVSFGPRPELPPVNEGRTSPPRQTVIRNLTIDERALVLALAVNIDFDYFSRHSGHHG
ncbi:Scramblase-domain-containing protein [Marasmius fiardii PR-910]|nr:Scramblase-domain-containing protein [Marasmius fiardii PR-910]